MAEPRKQLIGGEWVPGGDGTSVASTDPSDGSVLAYLGVASEEDVRRATEAAAAAVEDGWPLPAADRADILRRMAEIVRRHAEELAVLETREVGRPLAQSEAVAAAASASLDYFSTKCDRGEETNSRAADHLRLTSWEPIGVVAHILPWNFPLSMAANRIAMTTATGCTTVIKPSSAASLSVLRLAELVAEMLPRGVLNVVLGGGKCGTSLATDPLVRKVSFTGSSAIGAEVMKLAADSMKRVTLELGGKTPFLVFDDADVERAARSAVSSAFVNQGQSCAATSRILVHRAVHDRFVERLKELTDALVVGPGLDPATDVGPLISSEHRDNVAAYVEEARQRGATVLSGGAEPGGDLSQGSYYLPTLLTDVDQMMPVVREEVFGPVVAISSFIDEEEAIDLANDSPFGLCASVWTGDLARAQRVVAELEVGVAWANAAHVISPDSPWGGVKQSGIGRILGDAGLTGYLEAKQIHFAFSSDGRHAR